MNASKDHWGKGKSVRAGPCEGGFLGRGQGNVVIQKVLEDAVEGDGPGGGGGRAEAVDGEPSAEETPYQRQGNHSRKTAREKHDKNKTIPSLLGRSSR